MYIRLKTIDEGTERGSKGSRECRDVNTRFITPCIKQVSIQLSGKALERS